MINSSGMSLFGSTGTLLREERGTNFMGFEMEEESGGPSVDFYISQTCFF